MSKKIRNVGADSDETGEKIMCWTEEGKYIVDGKEVKIDYDIENVDINLLKKLEASPMTQLDAFYIRKNMHRIGNMIIHRAELVDKKIEYVDKKIEEIEQKAENFAKHEIECKAELMPKIAEQAVHNVVNGKFDKISKALENISTAQISAKAELIKYKEFQKIQHNKIIEQIQYTADKTIFGWVKNQWSIHPLRTLLVGGISCVIFFLYIMATLHIHSFEQMFEILKGWVH